MQPTDLAALLPTDFHDSSRAWIYQSNRPFSAGEAREIGEQLNQFYAQWDSHGAAVKGWAGLLFGQFIVVLADEEATGVSGCSTDGMVRVVKSLERQYSVQLFDRLTLTFLVEGKAQMLPLSQVSYALEKGFLSPDTPMFDNTVQTKGELLHRWLSPLRATWLGKRHAVA